MLNQMMAIALSFALFEAALPAHAEDGASPRVEHVLLVSVDGLHALDVANHVAAHPGSALAELSRHAVTYSNARLPANSDSLPGLLALITGGSPNSHGLFYDVSYNRSIFDPGNASCSGQPGNMQVFDESIDVYDSAGVSGKVIDPAKLPRYIDRNNQCAPKYPHNAVRSNTIFEVVKASGGRTAWADKHPAYDLVNGPSGKGAEPDRRIYPRRQDAGRRPGPLWDEFPGRERGSEAGKGQPDR